MSYPLLIVGGTGLVASAIIREAKSSSQIPDQSKHRILALSRSANSKQSVDGVNFVQGNALDPQSLQVPLESNPNVVHTVGTLLDQSKKYGVDGSYDKVNRDAAISVADAMAEKYDGSHRRCMVYFSASKAPPSFMLNERYLQTKREAEEALLGSKYKDKLRVVVFRPGLIYSYYRRQIILPFALSFIVGSAMLKPMSSYMPQGAMYLTDRPLSDTVIAHAVLEALEDDSVEGTYEIEGIRKLAVAWEKKMTS